MKTFESLNLTLKQLRLVEYAIGFLKSNIDDGVVFDLDMKSEKEVICYSLRFLKSNIDDDILEDLEEEDDQQLEELIDDTQTEIDGLVE